MANKTLLNAVNEIMKAVNVIAGDAAAFTTLTDAAQQHNIDIAIQIINEEIEELYTSSDIELPGEGKEGTITLATGTREYSLPSDFIEFVVANNDALAIDKTNTQYMWLWRGSYEDFLFVDPQQVYTGLPLWGMISPITGSLRVDRAPTSAENSKVYTYQYLKNLALSAASDTVPFNDEVFRAMVPAWAEKWKSRARNEFSVDLYRQGMGRAGRAVAQLPARRSYSPRG